MKPFTQEKQSSSPVGDSNTAAYASQVVRSARAASRGLVCSTADQRNSGLRAIANVLRSQVEAIVEANRKDLSAGESAGLSTAMLDRLMVSPQRVEAIADAVDRVVELPEVVGREENSSVRPNGLAVSRMRIPLGVVAIIYESRPNVTADAAALCLKSGNAAILRGGSEAFHTNQAIGACITKGLDSVGLSPHTIQVLGTTDRSLVKELLTREGDIDVVIPRGGEGLIRFVAEHSRIPVLKHYKGVCHVFVHEGADQDMALKICENAKVQRPGVCNAAETILIDRAIADAFVPALCRRLRELNVEVRGDDATKRLDNRVTEASESDWSEEYLDLVVAVRVVDGLEGAVEHIAQYGSDHTESIITQDNKVAERFLNEVTSSTVMVNASTRFADGGELGLGTEIGISTSKLHAYGPMGLEGLTSTKFVVRGSGQIRT